MIKYFMRKTICKKYDKEIQEMLVELISKKYVIEKIGVMFWIVSYIFPLIILSIIEFCENIELPKSIQIAMIIVNIVYFVGWVIFVSVFTEEMMKFSIILSRKIYFLAYTTKGRAISKKDFEIIKRINESLYETLAKQLCVGLCYSVCFSICKTLKKGYIQFLAVKNFPVDEHYDGKEFTVHVIYVNKNWAFDTYSSRQYPVNKIRKIYKAKIYKTFSFEDIKDMSYTEFRDAQLPELQKWCIYNDCSTYW